ncbi:transmembrane sugar transport protein [Klebsiella aerogenes]|nr:transmembrane sugar transport protein [Klebsiella aerogenes]
MSTAIQRRGRPGLATLIEKFPLILFLALLVWLSVQSPYFLSWQNISLMLVQSVPLAILCFGLVCVIAVGGDDVVSGGIDLSLPATAVLGVALLSLGLAEWHTPYLLLLALLAAVLPALRGDQRLPGAGGRPAAAAGHPLDLRGVYRPDRSVDRPATHRGQQSADGRFSR